MPSPTMPEDAVIDIEAPHLQPDAPMIEVRRIPITKALICLGAFALFTSVVWVVNILVIVLPETTHLPEECQFTSSKYLVITLLICHIYWVVVRSCLFMPGVAGRVIEIWSNAGNGMSGSLLALFMHCALHGPIYMLPLCSVLIGYNFAWIASECDGGDNSSVWILSTDTIVFIVALCFARAQDKLMYFAVEQQYEDATVATRTSPPGTLDMLPEYTFGEACSLYFEEDGGRYAEQCGICLAEWERGDAIKVTYCDHAFHKECLGKWLAIERTCALCRRDIPTTTNVRSQSMDKCFASPVL